MMWLWLQAIFILSLAFGMGLMIGGYLGHLALTQLQEKVTGPQYAGPKPSPDFGVTANVAEPTDYHGYEPEITPLMTPRTEDGVISGARQPDTKQADKSLHPSIAPVSNTSNNALFFPASSFGAMSETVKRQSPIISPLARLEGKDLEAALANVTQAVEPTRLIGAQPSKDDLKRIEGIGPVNEAELNTLGIYYFWQIASWTAEEVVWIAQHIHFPDRIVRENWIKQAVNLSL